MRYLPETIGTPRGPSVEGASPALLAGLLDEFETELVRVGVPVDDFLRPGAHTDFVREVFDRNGLVAPDEAVVWFSWHDGPTRVPGGNQPLPLFDTWSLDEADDRRHSDGAQQMGSGPDDWDPNWFQIIGPNAGIAIDCSEPPQRPALVRALSHTREMGTQREQTLQQVVSLCTPVTWWIEAIREGWYEWFPELNGWEYDSMAQPSIRRLRGLS
jgi:hypothetical protein